MFKFNEEMYKNHPLHKEAIASNGKYTCKCANNPEECIQIIYFNRKDRNYINKYVDKYYCLDCLSNGCRPTYKSNVSVCPVCLFDSDVQITEFGIIGNSYQCIRCFKWLHKSCVKNLKENFVCLSCNLTNKLKTKFGGKINEHKLNDIVETLTSPINKRRLKRKRKIDSNNNSEIIRKKKRRKLRIAKEIEKIRKKKHEKKIKYAKREEQRQEDRKNEKSKLDLYKRKIKRRLLRLEKIK